jgi:hypothetical protein
VRVAVLSRGEWYVLLQHRKLATLSPSNHHKKPGKKKLDSIDCIGRESNPGLADTDP